MDAGISWDVELAGVDGAVRTVEERVCFRSSMSRVIPEVRAALKFVATAYDEEGKRLAVGDDGIEVPADVHCVVLTLDLKKAADELDDNETAEAYGDVVIASPDVWLWRPEPWPDGAEGKLTLRVPAGMSASVPWPKNPDGTYAVRAATWRMICKCAFGKLAVQTLDVGDAHFTIARLPGDVKATDAGLVRWFTAAASAVSLVDGRFPVRNAQILVVPVDGGGGVPFGMALRGGGPGAVLLLSKRASDASLLGEWVAVHELSHLLIPPVKRDDAWMSEGLASYYQQIARGRSGLLTPAEAWGGLVDGFDRGKAAAHDHPLEEASARMGREYGFQTVYWGGAAILFNLDVALREKGRSLDALVAAVRVREPVDVVYRPAEEIVGWWAEAAPDVDVKGIVRAGLSARFPDVEPGLQAIGVVRGRDDRAVFDDAAPHASVRRAIMTPPDDKGGRNVLNSRR